tara:strand:+ start:40715 stop:41509 length:795 start_codon:yes stop_codon:yes gene_type:complete
MARVIIKLGGGLITDKTEYKVVFRERIDAVSEVISKIIDLGYSVIVIHGAGSFGHIEARKWEISSGLKLDISNEQYSAIDTIRRDMDELNSVVIDSLRQAGVQCETLAPRNWVNGVGNTFHGDVGVFERGSESAVPVSFGDVVDVEGESQFGILSGDHLMVRLANELPDVVLCAFLLGDADGLLTGPPDSEDSVLIERWSISQEFIGKHDTAIDVTGGILLKVQCASEIAADTEHVWFIDGKSPERILEILSNGDTVGTRIVQG